MTNRDRELLKKIEIDMMGVTSKEVSSAEPTEEIGKWEHDVGSLEYPLRKMVFLRNKYYEEVSQILVNRFDELTKDSSGVLGGLLFASGEKKRIVEGIISVSIQKEFFPCSIGQQFALRKGWVVVRVEEITYPNNKAWFAGVPNPPKDCGCPSCKKRAGVAVG